MHRDREQKRGHSGLEGGGLEELLDGCRVVEGDEKVLGIERGNAYTVKAFKATELYPREELK